MVYFDYSISSGAFLRISIIFYIGQKDDLDLIYTEEELPA